MSANTSSVIVLYIGFEDVLMSDMFDASLVDKAVQQIVETFSPEKIIVFGSVAKGTATEHSDLDILVIMDTELEFPYREVEVRKVISNIQIPKDVLVLTPSEFAECSEDPWDIAHEISLTGVVAYEKKKVRGD